MDFYGFYTGQEFEAYKYLGAHYTKERTTFRTFAPSAAGVELVLNGQGHGMQRVHDGNFYEITLDQVKEGDLYEFRIWHRDGSCQEHCDPYGFGMELRPAHKSVVRDLNRYAFTDEKWLKDREDISTKPLNIYEVHAGSFKKPGTGQTDWYTYEELGEVLIPYLKESGYNCVEFLPLSEHPCDESWGYQNTGFFAPTARYGTAEGLQKLVDQMHQNGIYVLLDFVPVHFATDDYGLKRYDGGELYEYPSRDVGVSEWGSCNFMHSRGEVRCFLQSAAYYWMKEFHFDGIRMDAISRALYWQGDPNRGVNEGAVNFLRSLNHGLNERWPTGIYMAEDSTNFLKVTAPTRYEGVGFDYKWDMGWMHDTLDYFATPFGERPGCYGKLLFSMHYFYNELYLLALSHDEVVHGKKTIIDKLWGTYAEKCAQLRTLYFYMYMHPGKKLNFMGNEMGHFREWDEKRELDWDLLKYPFHDAFQKYFAHLCRVYSTEPALYDGEYNPDCFEWVACESRNEGVYAWLRKGRGENLLCIMNTQDHAHKKFPLYLRFPCSAEEVLNTESPEWGGALKGRRKTKLHTTDGGVFGRDYTLTVDLPAMGSCLLRLAPEAPNPDAARISANKALNAKRRAARSTKAAANSNK